MADGKPTAYPTYEELEREMSQLRRADPMETAKRLDALAAEAHQLSIRCHRINAVIAQRAISEGRGHDPEAFGLSEDEWKFLDEEADAFGRKALLAINGHFGRVVFDRKRKGKG